MKLYKIYTSLLKARYIVLWTSSPLKAKFYQPDQQQIHLHFLWHCSQLQSGYQLLQVKTKVQLWLANYLQRLKSENLFQYH